MAISLGIYPTFSDKPVYTSHGKFGDGLLPSGELSQKAMERSTMLLMGKSTISTGPFSIAFCMFTRGYCFTNIEYSFEAVTCFGKWHWFSLQARSFLDVFRCFCRRNVWQIHVGVSYCNHHTGQFFSQKL